MLRLAWILPFALASASCISTRLIDFDNLALKLPPADPAAGWKHEVNALFDRYASDPVVAPEDQRLDPLVGGLTTLMFFGVDVQSRVRDQELTPDAARGGDLVTACTGEPSATDEEPRYTPVWLPLSRTGGAAADSVRCDAHGHASGERAQDAFCMFARLALRPEHDATMVVVVHGLFDSSAQEYLQRMAASLFESGHSVLLPDMRDHGDTLRAAPDIATTLGTLEGPDLLAVGQALRAGCAGRFARLGLAAVSGGALDAIRAFTLDAGDMFGAGVIAISPLLDTQVAIRDLSESGPCAITRSVELSWVDDVAIAGISGAAFFGGAALARGLAGERLNADTAIVAGIGAGVGLLTSLAIDAWFDGGAEPCITDHAISEMVQDIMRVRWRGLSAKGEVAPRAKHLPADQVTLETYLHERAQYQAARLGVTMQLFDPRRLASDLRAALRSPERSHSRLLVLGAQDDPMTRAAALRAFSDDTRSLPQVYSRVLQRGGHGGLSIVQPVVMQALYARFF